MGLKTISLRDGCEELLEDYEAHGIVVPKGFRFDGASTPRLFWAIIPPFKDTKRASLLHDYLCSTAKNSEDRLFADRLFFKMLLEYGKIGKIRASIGYIGVRIGSVFGFGVYYPHWTTPIKKRILGIKKRIVGIKDFFKKLKREIS